MLYRRFSCGAWGTLVTRAQLRSRPGSAQLGPGGGPARLGSAGLGVGPARLSWARGSVWVAGGAGQGPGGIWKKSHQVSRTFKIVLIVNYFFFTGVLMLS